MDRVILGRTGLSASVMGLGAGGDSRLGLAKEDEAASIRLVHAALDHGINFIDTAEAYGTEHIVGKAIRGLRRSELILSTKKSTGGSLEPADVVESLEASLRRLGTDYVDIYHLHGVAPEDYASLREKLVPALLRLREQGKIRFLGITEKFLQDPGHRMLQQALQDDLWDVVMLGFNLLNQSARERVLSLTLARGIGTLIMFAVRRASSRPERLAEVLAELCERGKISRQASLAGLDFLIHEGGATSLPDAAYRFCRHEPGAHVVLSGTSSLAHLAANVQSLQRADLPASDRARLLELFCGVDDISGQ
jgi:L-galactose dehydrogenase